MSDLRADEIVNQIAAGIAADRADLVILRERVMNVVQHGSHADLMKLAMGLVDELERVFERWADDQAWQGSLLLKGADDPSSILGDA